MVSDNNLLSLRLSGRSGSEPYFFTEVLPIIFLHFIPGTVLNESKIVSKIVLNESKTAVNSFSV